MMNENHLSLEQKHIKYHNLNFIYFSIALIVIITFIPFLKTGLTTGDDFQFYNSMKGHDNLFGVAKQYAKDTGRFHLLITKPFFDLAYIYNNFIITRSVHLFFYLLNYILAAIIIYKITHNKQLGLGFLLISITSIQLLSGNDPVTAIPIYFSFSLTLILLSFFLLVIFYNTGKKYLLLFSSFFYMCGLLFYELYITYFLFIMLYIIYKEKISEGKNIKHIFKTSYPYISVLVLYLSAYLIYRIYHPAVYDGSQMTTQFKFREIFKAVFQLSSGAFPLKAYANLKTIFADKSDLLTGHRHIVPYVILHAKIEVIIKACLIFFVLYQLILSLAGSFKLKLYSLGYFIFFILLIFIPQIPLGISKKYLMYTNQYGMWEYLTAYYSHFGVAGVLLFSCFTPVFYFKRKSIWTRIYVVIICISMSILSVLIGYSNHYVLKDINQSHLRFKMLEIFFKSSSFKNIEQGAVIHIPDIIESNTIGTWGLNTPDYNWKYYFILNGRNDIQVSQDQRTLFSIKETEKPIYYLYFNQARKTDDQILALAKVKNASAIDSVKNHFLSDTVNVFYYSAYKKFSLYFEDYDTLRIGNTLINDIILKPEKNYHTVNIINNVASEETTFFEIKGESIKVNSINISNILAKDAEKVDLW